MKIILLKNVNKLGKKGEIKEVADGFALNFLLPQGVAVAATDQSIKKMAIDSRQEKNRQRLGYDLATKLNGQKIVIKKQASEKGKLFAAISLDEVFEALNKKVGGILSKKDFSYQAHLKEIGEHQVKVRLDNKNEIDINIEILSEKK